MTRDYAADRVEADKVAQRERLLDDLGALISGLQVPLSIGVPMGTAVDPYTRLRARLNLFGYLDAEECARAIRKALEIEPQMCACGRSAEWHDEQIRGPLITDASYPDVARKAAGAGPSDKQTREGPRGDQG